MKNIFMIVTLIMIILFCNLIACANEALHYELTQDKIKRVWMSEIKDGYYEVIIELSEPHKANFLQLTENNIGKKLVIIFSGDVLTGAVIKGKIDSGIITVSKWYSEEDARKLIETLLPKSIKNGRE